METYDLLLKEPCFKKGTRFLRGNQLSRVYEYLGKRNRVTKFNTNLKRLIAGKNIIPCTPIYVVYNKSERMFDWEDMAEKSNKFRSDWLKIQNLVDNSEEYLK